MADKTTEPSNQEQITRVQEETEKEAETNTAASANESQAQLPPPQDNSDAGWGGWSLSAFSYISDLQKAAAVAAEEISRNVRLYISCYCARVDFLNL